MSRRSASPRQVVVVVATTAIVIAACTGPARTDAQYRGKAATTAEEVRGSVETARVIIDAARRHRLPVAYLSTALAEAEADAQSAEGTLSSIQPPAAASDRVRDRTLAVVGDATATLSEARITARRGDLADLSRYEGRLRRSSHQLDRLARSLQQA